MVAIVATPKRVVWWKEPTKDQWLAWWAGWLGWTLDAFDFTVFLLIMVPISKEFGVSLTEVSAVLPSPSGCAWSARGLLSDILVPVPLPRPAGHRYGGGMARRGGPRHGVLGGTVARDHERHSPGLVEFGLPAVERDLRRVLSVPGLARNAVDRHRPGPRR